MSGLIPQQFIDDLLNRTDIVDVVGERVQLKKSGRNHTACCPFHQEKTPSFSVNQAKQFYYCFGCGAGGNALGFIMDHDHLDFPQAVETLAARLGLAVPREQGSQRQNRPRQPAQSPLYALLKSASDFYQQALKQHPARQAAVNYLKQRGLSGQIARDFQLGFAPPGWDNLRKHFAAEPEQEKLLLEAGLLAENEEKQRRYDRFRDRIIFPIRDTRGRTVGFGGRVLGDDKPKYLNSPESPVFHKSQELYGLYEARQANRELHDIIVVEGYMDVIALAQQGISNAVATLGTATSGEHIKRLFRLVPKITFCFDGDSAGRKAAWRALETSLEHMKDGLSARFLFLPEGLDPDDLIRQEGVAAFHNRLAQQSLTLADYFFGSLRQDIDLHSLEGKAHLAHLASPLIGRMPAGFLRSLMHKQLQQLTGLDLATDNVAATPAPKQATASAAVPVPTDNDDTPPEYEVPPLDAYAGYANSAPEPAPVPQTAPARSRQDNRNSVESPYRSALRTLLQQPQLAHKVSSSHELANEDDPDAQLLVSVLESLQKRTDASQLQLLARWHGTEQGHLLRKLAEKEWLISTDNLEQQFFDTIDNLVRQQRENTTRQLIAKSARQELTDEEKQLFRQLLAQKKQ